MAIQLIECTPGFSEGRRHDVIEAIMHPFRTTPGCYLLDHRSDGMEACTAMARNFGRRLFHETEIPVYFFDNAAIRRERRCPVDLHRGGYDLLKIEASVPERRPDQGEPRRHPTAGATAIGAGKCPACLHVNLRTADLATAVGVQAGGLCHVEGNARPLKNRDMVQVRFTISDPAATPLYRVLEMMRTEARGWGVEVAETDIPGMVSAGARIQSAAYYLQSTGFHLDQVTELRLLSAMGDEA